MEADISTWQKTGHFYFALTELFTHGASLEAFKGLLGALRFQCCVPRLLGPLIDGFEISANQSPFCASECAF